ncbi:MAG: phenylalanine--tRNA ligase subunit beta, partial [Methanomicrobia archaeon]|nr:phenylalanine--tRNA ligase subunit beta [Methanomicrobia archaeon]
MKISVSWLKNYVSFSGSVEELATQLTMAGLEVESIEKVKGDAVLELEITPNRPDCLNLLGIAREVSAISNKKLTYPVVTKRRLPVRSCDVTIDDVKGCLRYIGVVIEGVKVGPSLKEQQHYLGSVGIRSISNIVDVTNFCMMELGQPLHAFDHDKLSGHKLIVRRARKGETIVTIDNVKRELDESILVIADQDKPVAIAGIMGGKETEVTDSTKNILLESATFDPILIRRASRKLGLSSDSSYRFERGVNIDTALMASQRACDLILQSSGGKITAYKDVRGASFKRKIKSIKVSLGDINQFLGSAITKNQCVQILKRLECVVTTKANDVLEIMPPSFRSDLRSAVDIMEELARIYGYNNIPSSLAMVRAVNIPQHDKRMKREQVRSFFVAQGFNEVVTYSMVSEK